MRDRAYWAAALVAWPAAVWSVIELSLRAVTGYADGAVEASLTLICAVGTLAAVHYRRRALDARESRL